MLQRKLLKSTIILSVIVKPDFSDVFSGVNIIFMEMYQYLYETFLREGHKGLIDDVETVFIDKTDPSDPEKEKNSGKLTSKPYHLMSSMKRIDLLCCIFLVLDNLILLPCIM